MFPDAKNPFYGVFVKKFCDQTSAVGIDIDLSVMKKASGKIGKVRNYVGFYLSSFFKALRSRSDIIYVHYASHSSLSVLAAAKLRKMTIYTNLHGSDVFPENSKQARFQKYTRQILKISTKIVVPSVYFKNVVSKKYQIPKERIVVYPSGGISVTAYGTEIEEA